MGKGLPEESMALKFVLGNSGSGKTSATYEKIVKEASEHPTKNYLFLVPEQFTLQTQRKLVDLAPNHVIMNIDVLSFKRLAYRVFDDLGITDVSVLEETGKNLILRKVAAEEQDNLTVMAPNMARIGYIEELKSLISELAQYNITPSRLEEYVNGGNLSSAFAAKLSDVVTMYRGFCRHMEEDSYITAEEILNVLIQVCDKSELLKGSVVVLDDFTGFTPIQNRLLEKMLPLVERMYVILTIDASEDYTKIRGEHELFYLTKKTIASLQRMVQNLAPSHPVVIEQPDIYDHADKKRFAETPDLAFLEANLFRNRSQVYGEVPANIQLACRKNPMEELIGVAREIDALVRSGQFRYRDIAVVSGAEDRYSSYAKSIFAKYHIPCFMDHTTEVLFHPFIECTRAALEIVEEDFSYTAIMRFLKCGYTGLAEEQIDELDNFLIVSGLRGRHAWEKSWLSRSRRNFDMQQLEETRAFLMQLLLPLADAFHSKEATVAQEITALYHLFLQMELGEKLQEEATRCKEHGEDAKYYENSAIYQNVMELLEKFYFLFRDEAMDIATFTELLDAGLSASKVAVLPPAFDSVTFGDIERTRLDHVQVLFFIGVNDGIVPGAATSGGIISEYERELLQQANLELAPGAREQAFIQRFYLYRNLTKPSKRLYLSYSRVDFEGKSLRESYLIGTLLQLFPKLAVEQTQDVFAVCNYATPEAALDYLIHGKRDNAWYALANCLLVTPEYQELMQQILEAPFSRYQPDLISRAVARAIYGRTIEGSVTRLERYAQCAYQHFLQYGLHLTERENRSLDNREIGTLYHEALRRYSERVKASSYTWFNIPDEVREKMAEESLQEAILSETDAELFASGEATHIAERMKTVFSQTVWALTTQVRAGRFEPTEFEIRFRELEDAKSLRMDLGEDCHMQLAGTIDRLDLCREEGRTYVKIIDYKSGNTTFDLVNIYRGQALQLVLYLDVAMEHCKKSPDDTSVLPAAMFYYHIDEPMIDVKADASLTPQEYADEVLKHLTPQGLVNSDEEIYRAMDELFETKSQVIPVFLKKDGGFRNENMASTEEFETIREYVRNTIAAQGREIFGGHVEVNPYQEEKKTSCDYCPYHAVCQMDVKIPGYTYRKGTKMAREEVLEHMKTENAIHRGKQQED